jgi:(p)ppGpp synthase/HD superfamily hydrolase
LNRYAQTNLQLYAQLRGRGCSEDQLLCARRAYEVAVSLFTGQFRPNGKPFLAHLVGTASILATHGAPIPVVAAGLLHAAYLQGEFGDGRATIIAARRRKLCQAVGDEVEKIIAGYTWFAWNDQALIAMQDNLDMLIPEQRDLVLIRLANALEDHLDLGMLYSGKRYRPDRFSLLVAVADQLGYRELAQDLAVVYADHEAGSIPDVLRVGHTSSYTVAPASHRRRLSLVVASRLNTVCWSK